MAPTFRLEPVSLTHGPFPRLLHNEVLMMKCLHWRASSSAALGSHRLLGSYHRGSKRLSPRSAGLFQSDASPPSSTSGMKSTPSTASTRAGPPAHTVGAEQAIPSGYGLPQRPKLDRQGLLRQLKRGTAIPGAEPSKPKPARTVRTK